MKKALSIILVLAALLSLGAAAFADGAELALPIYASIDEVDLAELLLAQSSEKLLDAFGNYEISYAEVMKQPDGTYHSDITETMYLIDGVYYDYTLVKDKDYGSTSEQYYKCDDADPYMYYKYQGGCDKFEYPTEEFKNNLKLPPVPFSGDKDALEITSAEEKDGLYVFTFSDRNIPTVLETTVSFDPATSLIVAYNSTLSYEVEIGRIDRSVDGVVAYGVDTEPNYSVKF